MIFWFWQTYGCSLVKTLLGIHHHYHHHEWYYWWFLYFWQIYGSSLIKNTSRYSIFLLCIFPQWKIYQKKNCGISYLWLGELQPNTVVFWISDIQMGIGINCSVCGSNLSVILTLSLTVIMSQNLLKISAQLRVGSCYVNHSHIDWWYGDFDIWHFADSPPSSGQSDNH